MSNIKEICSQINNIQNMQKITKVMKMIAAFKMRKTKDLIIASNPYMEAIHSIINHLVLADNLEYKHPYLKSRDVKCIGYLVISTDYGLCNSLNINLFKKLLIEMKLWTDNGIKVNLILIGSKAVLFFNSVGGNIIAQVTGIGDTPSLSDLIGPIKIMLEAYDNGHLDKLYVVTNKFLNTFTQVPTINQLLPLSVSKNTILKKKSWDYLCESDSKILLNAILHRYIESQVYQSVIENLASEQAARMVAMKTATENGSNLIKELQLLYNKARQAYITQELIEIVSGVLL